MAGAILVGNMALMGDAASPPRPHLSERSKIWPCDSLPLPRPKRDPPPLQFILSVSAAAFASSDSSADPSRPNRIPLFGSKSCEKDSLHVSIVQFSISCINCSIRMKKVVDLQQGGRGEEKGGMERRPRQGNRQNGKELMKTGRKMERVRGRSGRRS